MPHYLLIYQQQGTTEQVPIQVDASCVRLAREQARNNMNVLGHDGVQWPLMTVTLVEST